MTEIDQEDDITFVSSGALEDESHEPYYTNEISKLFCKDQVQLAQQMIQSFPPVQAMIELRSRHLDNLLMHQIASGCKQVVILGAGSDNRAMRYAAPDVKYFEIDHANRLQQKITLHHSTVHITYIAEDYLCPNLIEVLQHYHFNVHLPTYFLWEGSVPNLRRGDIIALLDILRSQIHQFQLSLDYLSYQMIVQAAYDVELNESIRRLETLGTSWITLFKDIPTFMRALGLKVIENLSIAEIHDRYYPQIALPSKLLQFYYVCTIEKSSLW